ncbi:uncharacterized protein LTR77_009525 [Saxophila tyrrhenica]|uniref:Uncharacterized protein n=1 Tax=Saxophila tyrrhenica TaxID=1690608 RepID=A0AAV9NZQ5_9PEZI|nr:hypothetical protein LTR77_009525 [Saxophila tyrrhenica]
MAETTQYIHDDAHPLRHPPPASSSSPNPQPWRSPAKLTTSSLQELRRKSGDEQQRDPTTPVSPTMSRRTSFESDRFSTVSGLTAYFPSNPANVNPKAQYVASFGASQVVSESLSVKRSTSSDDDEDKLNKDDVRFTDGALGLVNAFLDQLLYSFLSTARSTSLSALRPAVTEVLKHRLAREAITSAEEELAELLAGGDDDDEDKKHKTAEDSRRWDLELVWKRTRLRVMVYMRLGEMEDEDEQRYVNEEELFHGNERRFSQSSGLVSWAAAIFLTSILEFVAEQTLQVAGQASYTRARRQSRTQRISGFAPADRSSVLTVEEYDVEKVALNATLGRLWRTWRKALRNNNNAGNATPTYRSPATWSRENMVSALSHRRSSFGTANEGSVVGESRPQTRDGGGEMEFPEWVLAANIPLPMGDVGRDVDEILVPGLVDGVEGTEGQYPDELLGRLVALPMGEEKRDVDEIEVPGLAREPDGAVADDEASRSEVPRQRSSLMEPLLHQPKPVDSFTSSPTATDMPAVSRQRSSSLPTPSRTPMPERDQKPVEAATATEAPLAEQAVADDDAQSQSQEADRKGGNEAFPWMVGGAAITTAAAAAAAGVAGAASSSDREANGQREAPQRSIPRKPLPGDSTSQGLAIPEDVTAPGSALAEEQHPLRDVEKHPSQRSFSDQEIEELDRRKSLIDIKAMMFVNGSSGPASGQESPRNEETSYLRPASRASDEEVSEHEGPEDAIGVARTSDVSSPVPPRMSEEHTEARESPKPTGIVNGAPPAAPESPTVKRPGSMASQRQFYDLTSQPDQSPATLQRSPTKYSNRASLADGAQQSPTVEKPLHRQSMSADVDKDASDPQRPRSLKGTGQKMAAPKGGEARSPKASNKSPRLVGDPESLHAMTSASIRGPEDFDMFLQGADTVKYTLTPDNVRDDSTPNAPAPLPKPRQAPVEMDATSILTNSDSRVGRSQTAKQATSAHTTAGAAENESTLSKRRSVSKPSPRNTSAHRKSGLMAREPRVQTETTRDFADFIRSTGPQKEKPVYPLLSNASQTSLHSLRSAHIHGASASRSSSPNGERSRSNTLKSVDAPDVPPVPPMTALPPMATQPRQPKQPKQPKQPRPAKATTYGSSDLIDFIRSGPEEEGQHRISRSVAPFRTTMDSDQFHDLADRNGNGVEQFGNGNGKAAASASAPSVQSPFVRSSQRTSENSRSALLHGASNRAPAPAVQPVRNRQPPLSNPTTTSHVAEENAPVRKRVRNKDPYSMDFLDNDDEDDWFGPAPGSSRAGGGAGGGGEESLLDFLNSNEPPQTTAPQPLLDPKSTQAREALRRYASSGGNGGQQASSARAGAGAGAGAVPRSGYASPTQGSVSSARAGAGRAVSRSGYASPTAQSASSARPAGSGVKAMPRGGAKDIAATSNTQELADFFKNSGPSEGEGGDPESAPAPNVGRMNGKEKGEKKKKGGFFGLMRGRRRTTYLDMP